MCSDVTSLTTGDHGTLIAHSLVSDNHTDFLHIFQENCSSSYNLTNAEMSKIQVLQLQYEKPFGFVLEPQLKCAQFD